MKRKMLLVLFLCILTIGGMKSFTSEASSDKYKEGAFSYRVSKKEAIITGVDLNHESMSTKSEIVVPDKIGGFTVVGLDNGCFRRKSKITKVTLPATLKQMGYSVFAYCQNLTTIALPAGVKTVPYGTFNGCTKLSSVQLGSSLTDIEIKAFYNCISLKKITLPNSLRRIGDNAFGKCYKLSGVKLGNNVNEVGMNAFLKNYSMKSITLPVKMKVVGNYAFEKCTDLVKVKFKGKKTKIGTYAFSKCDSLKSIVFPKDIKEIPEYAFNGCKSLTKITIPKKVGIIKRGAFVNCDKLKTVNLNKKLYAVGDRAFAGSGLVSIKLNNNLQFIGNGAFQGTKVKQLTLKGKVTYIGNRVFADCGKLKTISIPASVKGINPGAFNNCTSLRAIRVAAGNKSYSSADGVLYNKDKTRLIQYPLHKTSTSFRTPSSVTTIRKHSFSGNAYLKNLTVSSGKIEEYAFYNMSGLRSVTLQSGVKAVGYSAFSECYDISKLVLSDSIENIGGYAFEGVKASTIHIPSSLKKMGSGAFRNCNQLKAFTGSGSSVYTVKNGVLYNKSMTTLIQYPGKKTDKTFTVPDSVKRIKSRAFNCQSYVTKIFFGKKLSEIDYDAIVEAKKLKSVIFDTKKTGYYSTGCITDCNNLAVVVGPNTYTMRRIASNANATLITL